MVVVSVLAVVVLLHRGGTIGCGVDNDVVHFRGSGSLAEAVLMLVVQSTEYRSVYWRHNLSTEKS